MHTSSNNGGSREAVSRSPEAAATPAVSIHTASLPDSIAATWKPQTRTPANKLVVGDKGAGYQIKPHQTRNITQQALAAHTPVFRT
jgi:hypothetical protein